MSNSYNTYLENCDKIFKSYYEDGLSVNMISINIGLSRRHVLKLMKDSLSIEDYEEVKEKERLLSRNDVLMESGFKRCGRCNKVFDLSNFHYKIDRYHKSYYYMSTCRECNKNNTHSSRKARTIYTKYKEYKLGAEKRNMQFDLTIDDFLKMRGRPCYYCDGPITVIGLDRVDNSLGYTLDNVVTCCSSCNYMKGKTSQEDFIEQCARVVRHSLRETNY